jgi:type I restriction enzyme S subunit
VTDSPKVPPGWALIPLGETGQWTGGGTPSKSDSTYWENGSIPWVSPKDMKVAVIHDTIDHITELAVEESSARLIPPNSILFVTRSGILEHTFPVAQSAVPVTVNQDIKALTPAEPLNPGYIAWGARAFEYEILQRCSKDGTTVASVDTTLLQAFPLPVAPVPEQHRIVEAIESYLTRLDDTTATLERLQRNLKRYRASVLKAAVEGRLVPSEAELARMERREYEPASVLLERILAERRRRWEEAELAKLKAKGKAPKNDKWKAKYVEPAGPVTSELPELPEGWCWATIEQVSSLVTDGDHNPPKRTDEGVPHLTAKSVKGLTLTLDGCSFLSAEGFEKTRSRYEPVEGDLIVTCVGTVGECAIVPPGLVFSADRNLAAVRLLPHGAVAKYVLYTLISPEVHHKLRGASGSTAQPHLYLKDLRALALPLPPKDEQFRIVYEVETLLSNERFSSDVVSASRIRNERLRQSILKWAFEGRLVDQDPSDEPADLLLERIRAERAASQGKKQSRTRPVNTKSVSA